MGSHCNTIKPNENVAPTILPFSQTVYTLSPGVTQQPRKSATEHMQAAAWARLLLRELISAYKWQRAPCNNTILYVSHLCLYIWVRHIYIYVCVYIYICMYMYFHLPGHMRIQKYKCLQNVLQNVDIQTIQENEPTRIAISAHTYVCVHMYIYIYTYICMSLDGPLQASLPIWCAALFLLVSRSLGKPTTTILWDIDFAGLTRSPKS